MFNFDKNRQERRQERRSGRQERREVCPLQEQNEFGFGVTSGTAILEEGIDTTKIKEAMYKIGQFLDQKAKELPSIKNKAKELKWLLEQVVKNLGRSNFFEAGAIFNGFIIYQYKFIYNCCQYNYNTLYKISKNHQLKLMIVLACHSKL